MSTAQEYRDQLQRDLIESLREEELEREAELGDFSEATDEC